MKPFCNPFYIYICTFSVTISLYSLRWSDFFIDLSWQLICFFIFSFAISLIFGFYLSKWRRNVYGVLEFVNKDKSIALFIILSYILEFLYSKNVPLLSIFVSSDTFIHFGGIPTFHVLLVTYNVFFAVLLFHKYLCSHLKINLFYFLLVSLLPPLLMVNRGMLFTIFFGCLFTYLNSLNSLSIKKIVLCLIGLSFVMYAFALLGKARIGDDSSDRIFVAFTQPSERFYNTGLSTVFLWPYMYAASPIGNLQLCIDEYDNNDSFISFIKHCIIPDFISNRIPDSNHIQEPPLLTDTFNVSTMYYYPYVYYGWLGIFMIFVYQIICIYFVCLFSRPANNPYYVTTISLLCSVIVLNSFTNMWSFSAISFPIVWGIISYYGGRLKW